MKRIFVIITLTTLLTSLLFSCEDDVIVVPSNDGECTGSYCKLDNSNLDLVTPEENPKAE